MKDSHKDLYDTVKAHENEWRSTHVFFSTHHHKLTLLLKSFESLQARLCEHESYDEKLKERFLKKSVEEFKKMKLSLEKDQATIR